MTRTGKSLAAACGLVTLAAVVSRAQATEPLQLSGILGGGYTNFTTPGGDTTSWNGRASANLMVSDPGINVQGNFADAQMNYPGKSGGGQSLPSYGGDVYWRDYAGTFGVNVTALRFPHGSSTEIGYGFFGEGYILPMLTLRVKAGQVAGDTRAQYLSAGGIVYPFRSIALNADLNYGKINHGGPTMRDAQLGAEFMPLPYVPVSLRLGYDFEKLNQFHDHINVLSVGLRFYFGGGGKDDSLRSYQRNGIVTWDGPPETLQGLTF